MLRKRLESEEEPDSMKINAVLDALSDKHWHRIDELVTQTGVQLEKVLRIVNFFRDYGFIEISINGKTVKLDKDYVDL